MEICPGCKRRIDPEVCWCGEAEPHFSTDHSFIPMGCDCGRVTQEQHVTVHAALSYAQIRKSIADSATRLMDLHDAGHKETLSSARMLISLFDSMPEFLGRPAPTANQEGAKK
jgi:hypothetical protein